LKKAIPKKRKGFKGVQKQAKRASNVTSEQNLNITFVGEDDVVSEMIPPPIVPASSRELGACVVDASSSDESTLDDLETAQGYRLVSMESLREFVKRIHTHAPCASGEIDILESSVNRMGMSSSIFAKCGCGMTEFLATGDHPSNDTTPRTIQGKDLNRRIVYGAFEMGVAKKVLPNFVKCLTCHSACLSQPGMTMKKH